MKNDHINTISFSKDLMSYHFRIYKLTFREYSSYESLAIAPKLIASKDLCGKHILPNHILRLPILMETSMTGNRNILNHAATLSMHHATLDDSYRGLTRELL